MEEYKDNIVVGSIDLSVYAQNKTLRLPFSSKGDDRYKKGDKFVLLSDVSNCKSFNITPYRGYDERRVCK